jgi:hypothetical protein
MDRTKSVVTPVRYASGMTFSQYVAYVGTPENLKREGTGGTQRPDNSAAIREWYEGSRLSDTQTAAWKWLAAQPGGPTFGRTDNPLTEAGRSPNADIMAEFMNDKGGKKYQSIPVVVFYDKDMKYLYHYVELPAIYHKDRVVTDKIRASRPGETPQQTAERAGKEFGAFQKAPFFRLWAGAGIDEMASALHERLVMGSL